jgi:hypothetical protein
MIQRALGPRVLLGREREMGRLDVWVCVLDFPYAVLVFLLW